MNYISCSKSILFLQGVRAPSGPGPHYRGFTITLRHTTLGGTPLEEWSARRRDLYLTEHNTHNRQTSMPPAGFEPAIQVSKRPQTHHMATGIDCTFYTDIKFKEQENGYLSYWEDTLSLIFIYETERVVSVQFEYPNVLECNLLAALYVWNCSTCYVTVLLLSNKTYLLNCKYSCVFGIVFLHLTEHTQR